MDRKEMTRRLLDFTLEILYLLTGEEYTVVKKTASVTSIVHLEESGGKSHFPIESPTHSLFQKILELTNKMAALLTGEVPIRRQDVSVYFSMEEWEFIEGHRSLYKDVIMDDNQPPTSQDGTQTRNPPERHPLYSQDWPEENDAENQQGGNLIDIKVENKDQVEGTDLRAIQQDGLMERNPPERLLMYSQDWPAENGTENQKGGNRIDIKIEGKDQVEEMDIRTKQQDGLGERNPPERCPPPLYPQDCPEEKQKVPENQQGGNLIDIKVEGKDQVEEMAIRADQDGLMERNPPERCPPPLNPQDCPAEKHNVPENRQGQTLINIKAEIKEEPEEMEISSYQQYGVMDRNPPERCPPPLHPQDCPAEKHKFPENRQDEAVAIKEEERLRGDRPCKSEVQEDIPIENPRKNIAGNFLLSVNCKVEDQDSMPHSSENLISRNVPPGRHSTHLPSNPPNHQEPSAGQSQINTSDTTAAIDYDRDFEVDGFEWTSEDSEYEEESQSSDTDSDDPLPVKSADPELEQLLRELREKAEASYSVDAQSFQTDPQWESLEAIPVDTNLVHGRIGNTNWCRCSHCAAMKTRDESKCCREEGALNRYFNQGLRCITELTSFAKHYLDEETLVMMVNYAGRTSAQEMQKYRPRVLRKAAYRQYMLFTHGPKGPKTRIPIPACVVKLIRNQFPDPDGAYVEFYWTSEYDAADMAYDA